MPGEAAPFYNDPIPFPTTIPKGLNDTSAWDNEEVKFDPKVHLKVELPTFVVDLDFKQRPYPLKKGEPFPGLAFTEPFRLLSEEGVKQLRKIVDRHANNPALKQSDNRTPLCIRGLGYVSQFVRDFNLSPDVTNILCGLANEPVSAHTMPMNYSQINVGAIGLDRPVDAWHLDSVDYVMVVILSDSRDMDGGKLEVVMRPTDQAMQLMEIRKGKFQEGETMAVKYPAAGYACFMQGCRMLHHVTPVKSAREPRMTCINSYVSRDVFRSDNTKYQTFVEGDPKHVTPLEFARHKAWRTVGTLRYLLERVDFPQPAQPSNDDILAMLDKAGQELLLTRDIISGKVKDSIGYYDEVNETKTDTIFVNKKM